MSGREVQMEKADGFWIISMSDLHDYPKEIRFRMSKGSHFLLTHYGKPLAYVRPIEEEDMEEPKQVMTFNCIRQNPDEFIFMMFDGESIVVGFQKRALALASPEIPEDIMEAFSGKKYGDKKDMKRPVKGGDRSGGASKSR